jgi:hypothetical protein
VLFRSTVVHSIVPAEQYPEIASYPASLRALASTMSEEQLIEMVSNKNSDFNRAERQTSAGK